MPLKNTLVAWLKFPKLSWYRSSNGKKTFSGAIVKPLLTPITAYAQLSGKAKWFAHILDGGGLGNGGGLGSDGGGNGGGLGTPSGGGDGGGLGEGGGDGGLGGGGEYPSGSPHPSHCLL